MLLSMESLVIPLRAPFHIWMSHSVRALFLPDMYGAGSFSPVQADCMGGHIHITSHPQGSWCGVPRVLCPLQGPGSPGLSHTSTISCSLSVRLSLTPRICRRKLRPSWSPERRRTAQRWAWLSMPSAPASWPPCSCLPRSSVSFPAPPPHPPGRQSAYSWCQVQVSPSS